MVKSQRRSLSSRHNNRPQTVSPPTNSTWRRLPVPVLLEHNTSASAGSSGGSSAAPHLKELTVFLCLSVVSNARPTIEPDSFLLPSYFHIFQLTLLFFLPTKCSLQGSALLQSLKRRTRNLLYVATLLVHPVTLSPRRPQLGK